MLFLQHYPNIRIESTKIFEKRCKYDLTDIGNESPPGRKRMDLASSISSWQQSQVQSSAQMLVMAKVLDSERQQGAAALQLLQSASATSQGTNPFAQMGLGNQLDVQG
jgi:hypothetical protein